MLGLFYGQATGAVTEAAALADKRYGDDASYRAYVAATPLILPGPAHLYRLALGGRA